MKEFNICCPSYLVEQIRSSFSSKDKLSFFTFEKLVEELSYKSDIKGLEYVYFKWANKNYSLSLRLVENAKSIIEEKPEVIVNQKIETLYKIRDDLVSKGLFKKDEISSYLIKKRKMLVYGYGELSNISAFLTSNKIDFEFKNTEMIKKVKKVYSFDELTEELVQSICSVCNLVESGVPCDQIVVVTKKDYQPLIASLGRQIGLELSYEDINISSTPFFNELIRLIKKSGSYDINQFTDIDDGYSGLVKGAVLGKIGLLPVGLDISFVIDYLVNWASLTNINSSKGVNLTSRLPQADEYKYVFITSFDKDYPSSKKDSDYLSDNEKMSVTYLWPSYISNALQKDSLFYKLNNYKELTLSFSKKHPVKGKIEPSDLTQDNSEFEIGKFELKDSKRPSIVDDQLVFSYLNYQNEAYGDTSDYFLALADNIKGTYPLFKTDNNGPHFDVAKMKLSYSFSSITDYENCPYKYMLKRLYRIDDNDPDSYVLDIGNLYHKVMEKYAEGEIVPFLKALDECKINLSSCSKEERFYLSKVYQKAVEFTSTLKDFQEVSGFNQIEGEVEFKNKFKDEYDINGKIDAIYSNDGEYIVVDYKTGKHGFDIDSVINGLDMQLPFYAYYLEKSKREEGKKFLGAFFLTTLSNDMIYSLNPFDKIFNGYPFIQKDGNNLFTQLVKDSKLTSKYFKGLRPKKYLYKDELFDCIEKNIDESIKGMNSGKYPVVRKQYVENDGAKITTLCANCPFKDCCFFDEKGGTFINLPKLKEDKEKEQEHE